jgi:hypothetical protein
MAEYPPPIDPTEAFNPDNWIPKPDTIDLAYLQANFCEYPVAQGLMNFSDLNVSADATISQNLLLAGTPTVNYLEFPDGTQQFSASTPNLNTVYKNISNTYDVGTTQIFQGSSASSALSAPINITNTTTLESSSFYLDPSPTYDLTLYTAQTSNTAGLTVRNPNYSFTVNPISGNIANFLNPISSTYSITGQSLGVNTTGSNAYTIYSNTTPVDYGLVIANTTGGNGSLTLSNNSTTLTTLTSTSTGLSINDPIIVGGGVSCDGTLTIGSSTVNSTINTATSKITTFANGNTGGGFTFNVQGSPLTTICNMLSTGFYIYNTLDMNSYGIANVSTLNASGLITGGSLTLSSGANSTSLTTTSTGLNCNDNIIIPSQTYPLASSNAVSTISYVNQAIASQGSGDVTQSGNNAFTGINSFSQVPTTSVTQTAFNTTSTQLATIGYITSFVYNNTQSVPLGPISILLQGGAYYTYSNSYYQTGVIGKSVFSLSTSGRATFSFSAQPNPQNSYSNNNAYLQLLSPTWGGTTSDASSISNGAQNPILLGIWNSLQSIAKYSFPFNTTTVSQINQYGQTFVSNVLYYPTNTQYTQVYRAYVSVFTANDNSQNVALYVYPPLNGIGAQLAVQICPFTFSFG